MASLTVSMDYTFEGNALKVVAQHCLKHMSHSVFGILVGRIANRMVTVQSAIPVCHRPLIPATFDVTMQIVCLNTLMIIF